MWRCIQSNYRKDLSKYRAFDIEYDCINLQRTDGQYILPYKELVEAQYDVIWITSPIFSTSVYYNQETENMIHKLWIWAH